MTDRRLIEESFPLKEVSEHAKHEKNVRHGHISTLHIWPARRPLAACRAAIIAALMPDPGDEAGRHELNKKIASITKWKTENGPALDYFRQEIRKAFDGRAPKVLDMFAGGGAIPLEAMRLGCDVTAIDYNPVAWFILKCTLEFPQRLAGKTWPLPADDSNGDVRSKHSEDESRQMRLLPDSDEPQMGDLADHVRYWGNWVLERAREELAPYYPTVDNQPTVAYLWTRTVPCPDPKCGCQVPLLKTLWLCKKAEKTLPDAPENRARSDFLRIKRTKNTSKVVINGRRALRLVPNAKSKKIGFEIWVPHQDKDVPSGTMSGATCTCPICGVNLSAELIKQSAFDKNMKGQMTAVIVNTGYGKEYRQPVAQELDIFQTQMFAEATKFARDIASAPLPGKERHRQVGSQLPDYGFSIWADIFTSRQLLAHSTISRWTNDVLPHLDQFGYEQGWCEGIVAYLALALDKSIQYSTSLCTWTTSREQIRDTYAEFNLSMTWDYVELALLNDVGGGYNAHLDWIIDYLEYALELIPSNSSIQIRCESATDFVEEQIDLILTDPPYYDSFAYADLSDLFFTWLRRSLGSRYENEFGSSLTKKEKELVQQVKTGEAGRVGKIQYEDGMAQAFIQAHSALTSTGYLVIVFAHKVPDAWETLVAAIIRAGFTVTASWPIDTERETRTRAVNSAALASSVWLVCRKRPENAGIGRYRAVRRAMETRVTERLRYFWDIGLSGPDFVWAAIGPALESYSSSNEVKRLDGSAFTVSDFLKEVRRMVADFALGQILQGQSTEGLDDWTRYYLMHRANFGLAAAPVGECILLSQGYGIDLNELRGTRGFMTKASGSDIRLTRWDERTRDDLGDPHPSGGLPFIDMVQRLMHLWSAGQLDQLNQYAAERGLKQNDLFWAVTQAILEMAEASSRERTLLEAIVAWGRGQTPEATGPEQSILIEMGQ